MEGQNEQGINLINLDFRPKGQSSPEYLYDMSSGLMRVLLCGTEKKIKINYILGTEDNKNKTIYFVFDKLDKLDELDINIDEIRKKLFGIKIIFSLRIMDMAPKNIKNIIRIIKGTYEKIREANKDTPDLIKSTLINGYTNRIVYMKQKLLISKSFNAKYGQSFEDDMTTDFFDDLLEEMERYENSLEKQLEKYKWKILLVLSIVVLIAVGVFIKKNYKLT